MMTHLKFVTGCNDLSSDQLKQKEHFLERYHVAHRSDRKSRSLALEGPRESEQQKWSTGIPPAALPSWHWTPGVLSGLLPQWLLPAGHHILSPPSLWFEFSPLRFRVLCWAWVICLLTNSQSGAKEYLPLVFSVVGHQPSFPLKPKEWNGIQLLSVRRCSKQPGNLTPRICLPL